MVKVIDGEINLYTAGEAREALIKDLEYLAREWKRLGIDPDAFCRCSVCHESFVDKQGNFIPCRCEREMVG